MSQVGYMFLALGLGAFAAGIFHFLTHAFFKALLFLAAGIVIQAQNDEHDIYKMGGLWKTLPFAGWTFLAGAASLAALPLITAGFYSKDLILWQSYVSPYGSLLVFLLALAGDFLTALYIFRAFFFVFFGPPTQEVSRRPGPLMKTSVLMLCLLLDHRRPARTACLPRRHATHYRLPQPPLRHAGGPDHRPGIDGDGALGRRHLRRDLGSPPAFTGSARSWTAAAERSPALSRAGAFVRDGLGFDWVYSWVFVRPYVALARLDRDDVIRLLSTRVSPGSPRPRTVSCPACKPAASATTPPPLPSPASSFVALFLFLR